MSNILQDLSHSAVVTAIEANIIATLSFFSRFPQAEHHEEAKLTWTMTDIPFFFFNSITNAQLTPEEINPAALSLIAQARSRKVPLLWWTGPATRPADLGTYLEKLGFIYQGHCPGMAIDLTTLRDVELPSVNGVVNDIDIQRVTDEKTLWSWCRVLASGFGFPDFITDAFHNAMRHLDQEDTFAFLGSQNGMPVATSFLSLASGVAGIYNVATIPEARRQGIGGLLTLATLRAARDMGYKVGTLHASKMGEGVYRAMGFEEYCQIGQYTWSPE